MTVAVTPKRPKVEMMRPQWLDKPEFEPTNYKEYDALSDDSLWLDPTLISPEEAEVDSRSEIYGHICELTIKEVLEEMGIGPSYSGIAFVHVLNGMKSVAAKLEGVQQWQQQ